MVPPVELKSPTKIPWVNLVITLLSKDVLGNDSVEWVGRFVTEHARFSMWFAREAKENQSLDAKELALLSIGGQDGARRIYLAWCEYLAVFEASGRLAQSAINEYEALMLAIRDAVSDLIQARGGADT